MKIMQNSMKFLKEILSAAALKRNSSFFPTKQQQLVYMTSKDGTFEHFLLFEQNVLFGNSRNSGVTLKIASLVKLFVALNVL